MVAPVPTVFCGGNHEAVNHLRDLYYGGWVAPNIYFLGYSSVIQFGGVRIGGFSGIFKAYDFGKGLVDFEALLTKRALRKGALHRGHKEKCLSCAKVRVMEASSSMYHTSSSSSRTLTLLTFF